MLARIHRVLCTGVLATAGLIACAPATSGSLRETNSSSPIPPLSPTGRVIDASRIARSGSQTAFDAIRALVPGYRSIEAGPFGGPVVGTSYTARGSLRVIVDGHPISDVESLRLLPARELLAIHIQNAADATIRFGPSFTGGALVLQTRSGLRPLD
jgi:hypothetical protein